MAARLWPHAWKIWAAAFAAGFAWLEDTGFHSRRPPHVTLSRLLAPIPGISLVCGAFGIGLGWHLRQTRKAMLVEGTR